LPEETTADALRRYNIEPGRFDEAMRALAMYDCNRDDAEFFLVSLLPLLFGGSIELKTLKDGGEPQPHS
jgi:hypothetical protein